MHSSATLESKPELLLVEQDANKTAAGFQEGIEMSTRLVGARQASSCQQAAPLPSPVFWLYNTVKYKHHSNNSSSLPRFSGPSDYRS